MERMKIKIAVDVSALPKYNLNDFRLNEILALFWKLMECFSEKIIESEKMNF